jgi:hypothetical protein
MSDEQEPGVRIQESGVRSRESEDGRLGVYLPQ